MHATAAKTRPSNLTHVWTIEAIRALGATTDVQTTGAILGVGRTKAYEMVREGNLPVPVLRMGRRILVPTPSILTLLGAGTVRPARDPRGRPQPVQLRPPTT
jgi:hypothetical protein